MESPSPTDSFRRANNIWVERAGVIALMAYAFFWLVKIDISISAESMMFVLFVWAMFTDRHKLLLRESILYLFVAWVLFQIGLYYWADDLFPHLRGDHIRDARLITNIFMFVVVAWWLGGSSKTIALVLALCALGFVLGAMFQDGGLLDELKRLKRHQRLSLGYRNAEHTSVYATFVLFALATFRRRIVALLPHKLRHLTQLLIFLAILFCIVAILGTQTRATWIGIIVSAALLLLGYLTYLAISLYNGKKFDLKSTGIKALWLIAGTTVAFLFLAQIDADKFVSKRIQDENRSIERLWKGEISKIKQQSIGIRLTTWRLALDRFKERPLTGWGPSTIKHLIAKSTLPKNVRQNFGHLHNSYLEVLVAYGLVGIGLLITLFVYVWCRAIQAWRAGHLPTDIMLFALAWTPYWLIVNFFESYIIFSETGNYLNAIVMGLLYTYHLKNKTTRALN